MGIVASIRAVDETARPRCVASRVLLRKQSGLSHHGSPVAM